jgi:NADPH-dependent curcumin reductase CurA
MPTNRQWRLAARPVGLPDKSIWQWTETAAIDPKEGEVQVRIHELSLDPAMRGWINEGKSYVPPVGIGEVMRALGLGEVAVSRHPNFAPGDWVTGIFGLQDYATAPAAGLNKIDLRVQPLEVWLHALGMTGMTAYFGFLDVCDPKPGETVVVSGAAGAVGSLVGQIAKIKGCRAIGIAGGKDKCSYLVSKLGFDAAIDYKTEDVRAALETHCPKGVDCYFDNVGGAILEAVMANLALHARISFCGAISQYNDPDGVTGPRNYRQLLVRRSRVQGFIVFDYAARYGEAVREMMGWLKSGQLKSRVDVRQGLENFPDVFLKLFSGENNGKLILKII